MSNETIADIVAEMREALSDACYAMFNFLKTQSGGYEEMANALDKARAALSAPARNCDVGTAEEQQERFREFCRRHEAAGECGIGRTQAKCPCWQGPKNPDCSFWWAQMTYEEGGEK